MSKKKPLLRKLSMWHSHIGLYSTILLIVVATTGILLNHTDSLKLSQRKINASFLLWVYGIPQPKVTSYEFPGANRSRVLTVIGRSIFLRDKLVTQCNSRYVSAVFFDVAWALACDDKVVLLDHDDVLIDILDKSYDTAMPIEKIAACEKTFCIWSRQQVYMFDYENSMWRQVSSVSEALDPLKASLGSEIATPRQIKDTLMRAYAGSGLSWERVVLDIHAGRFMGRIAPWFMDLIAFAMIFLALSGVYFAIKRRTNKRSHTQ